MGVKTSQLRCDSFELRCGGPLGVVEELEQPGYVVIGHLPGFSKKSSLERRGADEASESFVVFEFFEDRQVALVGH